MTLLNIRYYAEIVHPDKFKNSGWRGFLIRAVNWIRWRLETFVQWNVLKWMIAEQAIDKARGESFLAMFKLDVEQEKIDIKRTSPNLLPFEEYDLPNVVDSADKYFEGRTKNKFDSVEGGPPKSIEEMSRRYGAPPRERRYARGKKFTLLDPDGDFLPVVEIPE